MTTINTSEDLLRLLREDRDFYDQARRLILTDELIALPERFAAMATRLDNFITGQEKFNDEQRRFNERTDARFDRIERDLSTFKNRFSESQVAQQAASIAMAMDLSLLRVVANTDLAAMCRHQSADDIPRDSLVSFTRADLVLEAVDQENRSRYVAVEVSHTADQRDTRRALRNADYITRFIGQTAHAAVASVRNDRSIQPLIDAGTILWYPLEDEADEADAAHTAEY